MTFHFLLRFEEISVSLLFVEVDQWLRSVGHQAALGAEAATAAINVDHLSLR